MRTARARRSPGTCSRRCSPRSRSSGWCSTRSPRRPSSARPPPPATSTPGSSTPRRPAASSTGSTATRSARCCGARSRRACPPAACSRSRPAWSSSASASGWRSAPPATGTSRATSPRMPSPTCSPPSSPASTARKVATGRDFADDGTLTNAKATPLDEAAATGIANALRAADVTVTDVVREALHPPAERPVHDEHPAAGGLAQAAAQQPQRDAGRPAALRERLHHLHAYRQHVAVGVRADRGPHPGPRDVRRGLRARRPAPLREEGQERAGGPRGHPPRR